MIVIVLLATTPRSEMHSASYVFGSEGIVNQTGGWNTGIAFLFGLLSVQWTVSSDSIRRGQARLIHPHFIDDGEPLFLQAAVIIPYTYT